MSDERRCIGCGERRSSARFIEDRSICQDCGITLCRSCRGRKPDPEFRDPTQDPICRDCEVRPLSDDDRANLRREEREYRGRLKLGHLPWTEEERHEVIARRAALAGVSVRRYRDAEDGVGWYPMLWVPIHLVSAVVVSIVAIWRGASASPPELLPISLTILLLAGWLFFLLPFVDGDLYRSLELRMALSGRDFFPALALGALVVPVLIHVLVLIVVPG